MPLLKASTIAARPASSSGVCECVNEGGRSHLMPARSSTDHRMMSCTRDTTESTKRHIKAPENFISAHMSLLVLVLQWRGFTSHLRTPAPQMLTPYACPKGLVPMPSMETWNEFGFPGTRGCLGIFAVMSVVTERMTLDVSLCQPL